MVVKVIYEWEWCLLIEFNNVGYAVMPIFSTDYFEKEANIHVICLFFSNDSFFYGHGKLNDQINVYLFINSLKSIEGKSLWLAVSRLNVKLFFDRKYL